jgi:hypothetical protein
VLLLLLGLQLLLLLLLQGAGSLHMQPGSHPTQKRRQGSIQCTAVATSDVQNSMRRADIGFSLQTVAYASSE